MCLFFVVFGMFVFFDLEVKFDVLGFFGFGFYFNGEWFSGLWVFFLVFYLIVYKELFLVVIGVYEWGFYFVRYNIFFFLIMR